MIKRSISETKAAGYVRPEAGLTYTGDLPSGLVGSRLPAWQSNGGPQRGHPARALPFTLEVLIPPGGELQRVHLVGIMGLFSSRENESAGTLGASIQLVEHGEPSHRVDMFNGRHYFDALELDPLNVAIGDGTTLVTVGEIETSSGVARVDLLSFDVPPGTRADTLRFKDLGSPASFIVFDVFFERAVVQGCPFHSSSGGVGLAEIPSVVRVGDRVKFSGAIELLRESIRDAEDLDEARGQALTFLAMVTAATLEMGGSRSMHRIQLEAAREFDRIESARELADAAVRRIEEVAQHAFKEPQSPSAYLVDRALTLVERNFAKDLTDATVAAQLGLSTSHFRYLFKEATGQPFHKFLVSVRLEKARQMLVAQDLPVSEVAKAVGFGGLSHFSRAFTQRFSVSPTHLRRGIE